MEIKSAMCSIVTGHKKENKRYEKSRLKMTCFFHAQNQEDIMKQKFKRWMAGLLAVLTVFTSLFTNGTTAFAASASANISFRGTERTYNSVKMASGEQSMYISSLQHRYYSIHDLTAGVHAKVDLQLENNKLEWYNMYVCTNSKSVRYNNSVNTEYISSDSYTQDDETRSLSQTQSIFATHLKGTHHLTKDFTADWAGIFSQAKAEDPDRVYLSLTNTVQSADGVDGSLWSGNKNILKTLPKNMERRFQHNTDKDWAGYINLAYNSQLGNDINALWKAGAQYRRKERGNRYYSYIFNPSDISQKLDGNGFDQFAAIRLR